MQACKKTCIARKLAQAPWRKSSLRPRFEQDLLNAAHLPFHETTCLCMENNLPCYEKARSHFYGHQPHIPNFLKHNLSFYNNTHVILWNQTPNCMKHNLSFYGHQLPILWTTTLFLIETNSQFYGEAFCGKTTSHLFKRELYLQSCNSA